MRVPSNSVTEFPKSFITSETSFSGNIEERRIKKAKGIASWSNSLLLYVTLNYEPN